MDADSDIRICIEVREEPSLLDHLIKFALQAAAIAAVTWVVAGAALLMAGALM